MAGAQREGGKWPMFQVGIRSEQNEKGCVSITRLKIS